MLWLYLARSRAGQDGRSELGKNAQRLKVAAWPGQVVGLYLGNASAAAILQAAKDRDPKKDKEQHCEAYFYLADHALLRGDRAETIRLFKAAIDTGVTSFIEYTSAQA